MGLVSAFQEHSAVFIKPLRQGLALAVGAVILILAAQACAAEFDDAPIPARPAHGLQAAASSPAALAAADGTLRGRRQRAGEDRAPSDWSTVYRGGGEARPAPRPLAEDRARPRPPRLPRPGDRGRGRSRR
ncbi:hypothetical protein [Caulobacter sp. UNC358MFTsu5.1]|uniref:hypothetical protein n=1 Tax=Caulobacter sp. UNC358MFTsu5.1 TaxID=1449049 RepID=UPI0012DE7F61|nr:hypothetical protein [Caulobacter sp. UNC358MFTsu5.1]